MKVYTKTGDKGKTALIGGKRVYKDDLKIEAYGTVDELNSTIGLVRDLYQEEFNFLILIQDRLFTLGSLLASTTEKSKSKLPQLIEEDVLHLEAEIDKLTKDLPALTSFILPGGHPAVSHTHIARCICRRAERRVVSLNQVEETDKYDLILAYLNRLSDYLFTLARKISIDVKATETAWNPKK